MTAGDERLAELRVLCAAAGIEVPDEDLPALAEALSNHRAGAERLRGVDAAGVEPASRFDPRWTS